MKRRLNAGVPRLRALIRDTRETRELSRGDVVEMTAAKHPDIEIAVADIEFIETRVQSVPAPEILSPLCSVLGIERDIVLEVLHFKW